MTIQNLIKPCLALIAIIMTSGCVPLTAATTAVVGTSIVEERSAGDRIDDNLIVVKIKEAFIQADTSELFESISVSSIEGRVMLTGSVKDEQIRSKAESLAWDIRGVKEVINELEVDKKELSDRANDMWIASTVRSKLLFEKDLRSVNYVVDVNHAVVYLLGIAQDDHELQRALKIASTVKGVKRVVNHVILKDDPRRLKAGFSKKKEM
jgi:osmotically-inducible protein OsmY